MIAKELCRASVRSCTCILACSTVVVLNLGFVFYLLFIRMKAFLLQRVL